MIGTRKSRLGAPIEKETPPALTAAVQSAFPTLGTEQRNAIAKSVDYADLNSTLSGQQIIDLLARAGNDIWDFKYRGTQFQDAAGTIPVTSDGQPIRLIKPLKGSNNLVVDAGYNSLFSGVIIGAEFPDIKAKANLTTKRADLAFTIMAIQQKIPAPAPTVLNTPFLLGSDAEYDFHPAETVALFHETYAPNISTGSIWLNNVLTANTAQTMPTAATVISCKPNGVVSAASIAGDRQYFVDSYRTLYGRAFLYLVSSETFTNTEIDALNKFVMAFTGIGIGM